MDFASLCTHHFEESLLNVPQRQPLRPLERKKRKKKHRGQRRTRKTHRRN